MFADWQKNQEGIWTPFTPEENEEIEKAFQKKETQIVLQHLFVVDFGEMKTYRRDDPSQSSTPVRRIERPAAAAAAEAAEAAAAAEAPPAALAVEKKVAPDAVVHNSTLFQNMVFMFTSKEDSDALTCEIEKRGGLSTQKYNSRVTHLITRAAGGGEGEERFVRDVTSRRADVKVLRRPFIDDCIASGVVVGDDVYRVKLDKRGLGDVDSDEEPPKKKKQAEIVVEIATWLWQSEDGWMPYDEEPTKRLEAAFAAGESRCKIDDERYVDLRAMQQKRYDNPAKHRAVKREEPVRAAAAAAAAAPKKDVRVAVKKGKGVVDSGFVSKVHDWRNWHVYHEGDEVFSATLNLTDIGGNNNKFYIIQILQSDDGTKFQFWARWGRVGALGQTQRAELDLFSAKREFEKKFRDKTHNDWSDRSSFRKVDGKYDLVEIDFGDEKEEKKGLPEAAAVAPAKPIPASKLDDRIQTLLKLVYDERMFDAVLREMDIDVKRMPLGRLSPKQIERGYDILKEVEAAIKAPGARRQAIIMDCSSRFYTLIPHDFGRARPPLIDSLYAVKTKIALLETLLEMQAAGKVIKEAKEELDENPMDAQYKELHADIVPVERGSEDWRMVEDYIRNSHAPTHDTYALTLRNLFAIKRDGERAKFEASGVTENRMLLWHGSRRTNFAGIISQGLRIAPPEAPVTGYMFGKGCYFASMCSKAANYCHSSKADPTGIVLLCEVALGNQYRLTEANEELTIRQVQALGCDSTMGEGKTRLDPAGNRVLPDGLIVPLGRPVKGVDESELLYDEFIVYQTAQVSTKWIVQLGFEYK